MRSGYPRVNFTAHTSSKTGITQLVYVLVDGAAMAISPHAAMPTNTSPHTRVIMQLIRVNVGVCQYSSGVVSGALLGERNEQQGAECDCCQGGAGDDAGILVDPFTIHRAGDDPGDSECCEENDGDDVEDFGSAVDVRDGQHECGCGCGCGAGEPGAGAGGDDPGRDRDTGQWNLFNTRSFWNISIPVNAKRRRSLQSPDGFTIYLNPSKVVEESRSRLTDE